MKTDFHLEGFRHDPDAVVIVCDRCGNQGPPMSRSWNWNDKENGWEPQDYHYPPCGHVKPRSGLIDKDAQ